MTDPLVFIEMFLLLISYFICIGVLLAHICAPHVCLLSIGPKAGIRCPGAEFTNGSHSLGAGN